MAMLYLVKQEAIVRREQERFVVKTEDRKEKEDGIEIPIREVEQILVFGNVQLTTPVISSCLEWQIPVIFLTQLGEYKGQAL